MKEVTLEDLEPMIMLKPLTTVMKEKLLPFMKIKKYQNQKYVFRQGDPGNFFYMLKKGKIVFEQAVTTKITLSMGSVKPGYSFGWSAMLDGNPYTSDAVCAEPCAIISMKREDLLRINEEDHDIGYIISQGLLHIIKNRLDFRTGQFLRMIRNHPDMKPLI